MSGDEVAHTSHSPDLSHELQHASLLTTGSLTADLSTSENSTVRVEISDYPEVDTEATVTTSALHRCTRQVLTPYWRLLMVIGWRAMGKTHDFYNWKWRLLNAIYPLTLLLLLIYAYIYEIMACQGKLDLAVPLIPISSLVPAATITHQPTASPSPQGHLVGTVVMTSTTTSNAAINISSLQPSYHIVPCGHIFTTYIVPDTLHLLVFIMGFCMFRLYQNEEMYSLIEQVFLKASPTKNATNAVSEAKMIRSLRLILLFGAVWTLFTVLLHSLYFVAYGVYKTTDIIQSPALQYFLLGLEMVGMLVINLVNTAVIMNYTTQCEMLIYYVNSVHRYLQERAVNLQYVMQDVLKIRSSISRLNGAASRMASLCGFIFTELTIIGLCILILNRDDEPWIWVYRVCYPLTWFIYLLFPFVQASRLNLACKSLKLFILEVRVFGYLDSSREDLDSFILFLGQTTMQPKLFYIPVKPSYFFSIVIAVSLLLLLLFQTDVIGGPKLLL